MSVGGFISGLKAKARDRETRKAQAVASNLEGLRKERIRVEGQNKIYDLQTQEKAKIAKAKADLKKKRLENSVIRKFGSAVKSMKKPEVKKGMKKENPFFNNDSPNKWFK